MATRVRGSKATPDAPPRPSIEDVEDILKVAVDQRDAIHFWRRRGDVWAFLEPRPVESLRALGIRESARQRFGGGDFKARLKVSGSQWRDQRMFTIEGEPKVWQSNDAAAPVGAPIATVAAAAPVPAWVSMLGQIMVPVGIALATGLTTKLLSDPKVDPLLLELLKRTGKGENIDMVEMQRLLTEREKMGEERGRQLGELVERDKSGRRRGGDGASENGVVTAIREGSALFQQIAAERRGRGEGAPLRRRILPPKAAPATPTTPAADAPATSEESLKTPDITPAWLTPFMPYRRMLVGAADTVMGAGPIAGLIAQNADDDTWAAVLQADADRRIEADLLAAVPELRETPRRLAFVKDLVLELHEQIEADAADGDEDQDDEASVEAHDDAVAAPATAEEA